MNSYEWHFVSLPEGAHPHTLDFGDRTTDMVLSRDDGADSPRDIPCSSGSSLGEAPPPSLLV